MPIYAYKCSHCGYAKDVLQKMSDAPLTVCPQCGESTFSKQVTAAGFQLKGSGWYVTDFRDGGKGAKKDKPAESAAADAKDVASGDTVTASATPKPDAGALAAAPSSSPPAPAPAASPAPSGGTSGSSSGA